MVNAQCFKEVLPLGRLSATQIKKIIEIYNMTNSIEKTRDITGHASATITNYVGNLSSKKSNSIHCKNEIYQIDAITEEVIKIWDKPSIAARELNINPSSINRALKGHIKKAGGFIWKYK